MDINQLSKLVKKKILENNLIDDLEIEDKSYLHKDHKGNQLNKFHLKLKIKSNSLKNMNRIESNKIIYKLIDKEMNEHIHSLQILFF